MNYVKSLSMLQKTVSPTSELCHSLIYNAQHIYHWEKIIIIFLTKTVSCIDTIDLKCLIWTENRCAFAVDLRNEQQMLFDVF